jgi:hypothetical protein
MFCNHGVRAIKLFFDENPRGHGESAEQTWNERNKKQFPRLQKLRKAAGGSHTHALSHKRNRGRRERIRAAQQGVCFADLHRAALSLTQKAPEELELARESWIWIKNARIRSKRGSGSSRNSENPHIALCRAELLFQSSLVVVGTLISCREDRRV